MSEMTRTKKAGQGSIALSGLICGTLAMMLTLLILLGVSWMIASGKLSAARENLMIMLAVFLGTFFSVLLLRPGKAGELLPFALMSVVSYIAILIVMELSAGTVRLFGGNMLKIGVCAVVGTMLGITLKIGRSDKRKRRGRSR